MIRFDNDGAGQWQARGANWDAHISVALAAVEVRVNHGPGNKHATLTIPFSGSSGVTNNAALVEALGAAKKIIQPLGLQPN